MKRVTTKVQKEISVGAQHQDVIEINGKKYNAITGKLISGNSASESSKKNSPTTNMQPTVKHPTNGVVMDGFTRRQANRSNKKTNISRQSNTHKKPIQKSNTLMRNIVKKPQTMHLENQTKNPSNIAKASYSIPESRQRAAVTTRKSSLVSHYGDVNHRSSVVKKIQNLSVKSPSPSSRISSGVVLATKSNEQTEPKLRQHATTLIIEKALANAKAHEQEILPAINKKRKKLAHKLGVSTKAIGISSSVLAVILLAGFIAIQNVPNLSMRIAAARAGFSASMPGYNPSGFSFKGPINYSPGQVVVTFRSNTDDRQYKVIEKSSSWNSDALLSNFVVAEGKQYQTYIDRGRTLYIYDGSNATWVDNGVWYQVEGNSDMTTDQLVRIAASI